MKTNKNIVEHFDTPIKDVEGILKKANEEGNIEEDSIKDIKDKLNVATSFLKEKGWFIEK